MSKELSVPFNSLSSFELKFGIKMSHDFGGLVVDRMVLIQNHKEDTVLVSSNREVLLG